MKLRQYLKEKFYRQRPLERFIQRRCMDCKHYKICSNQDKTNCIHLSIRYELKQLSFNIYCILLIVVILIMIVIMSYLIPKPLNIDYESVCNIKNIQSIIYYIFSHTDCNIYSELVFI